MDLPLLRFFDQIRHITRRTYYAMHARDASGSWIKRSLLFYHTRHPGEMGADAVEATETAVTTDHTPCLPRCSSASPHH